MSRNTTFQTELDSDLQPYLRQHHDQHHYNSIQRLSQENGRLSSLLKQANHEIEKLMKNIEQLNHKVSSLQKQKQKLKVRNWQLEQKSKSAVDLYQSDKAKYEKEIRNLKGMVQQHEHTFKQKQKDICSLKEALHKQNQGKFVNDFKVIKELCENGPANYLMNAEHQYNSLAAKSIENTVSTITEENQYLKNCLINIYKELNFIVQLKKELLRDKNGGYDPQFQNMKPERFNLPEKWGQESFESLNTSIQKLKGAIQFEEYSQRNGDDECTVGVRKVLKNYKQIVKNQNQMLNRVMINPREMKYSQIRDIEEKFAKTVDNFQLENTKNFINEQSRFLAVKGSQLQKTRKEMQETMKKAMESKRDLQKKQEEYSKGLITFRKAEEPDDLEK